MLWYLYAFSSLVAPVPGQTWKKSEDQGSPPPWLLLVRHRTESHGVTPGSEVSCPCAAKAELSLWCCLNHIQDIHVEPL